MTRAKFMGLCFQVCLALLFMAACKGYEEEPDYDESDICLAGQFTKMCAVLPAGFYSACFPLCTNGTYFECSKKRVFTKICAIEMFRNKYGEIVPIQMVFDPSVKHCVKESLGCPIAGDILPEEVTTGCLRNTPTSCQGKANGNYATCNAEECRRGVFFTCTNGYIFVRACPPGHQYNKSLKRCEYKSNACGGDGTPLANVPECLPVSSTNQACRNVAAGDYAACDKATCRRGVYYNCANNYMYTRNCPWSTFYDSSEKRCMYASVDCPPVGVIVIRKEPSCISKANNACMNVAPGDYPPCEQSECTHGIYYTCANNIHYTRNCPASLFFNKRTKRCDNEADTCTAIDGKSDSSYQLPDIVSLPAEKCVKNTPDGCTGKKSTAFPSCVLSECRAGVYYNCDGKPYPRNCPHGLYIDTSTQKTLERPKIFDDVTNACQLKTVYCPLPTNIKPKSSR